jgi:hypothetical protein
VEVVVAAAAATAVTDIRLVAGDSSGATLDWRRFEFSKLDSFRTVAPFCSILASVKDRLALNGVV